MRVRGGKPLYGFRIGILVLDTHFPRIPGDLGHAATFDFPVLYHRVPAASPDRVVRVGDPELLKLFLDGAQVLEREGVGAITTTCGFLARFQRELAAAVGVPVFTSSLLLVPLIARMLGPGRAVGVLTIDAGALRPAHYAGAGITPDVPVVVVGLEREGAGTFARSILQDALELDVAAARAEHQAAARRLVTAHPEVGAIVLECANMPPYRADVRDATGLPVFDMTDLIRLVRAATPPDFPELGR